MLVPTARKRFPEAEIAVGMPMEVLLASSKRFVTFFNLTKDMFSIYSKGSIGIDLSLS